MTLAVVGGVCVVVVVVVVVKNFNLAHNFFITEANVMKPHTLVHHHKGYNLTKGHNSVMHFDQIMPLYGLRDFTDERWPPCAGLWLDISSPNLHFCMSWDLLFSMQQVASLKKTI